MAPIRRANVVVSVPATVTNILCPWAHPKLTVGKLSLGLGH